MLEDWRYKHEFDDDKRILVVFYQNENKLVTSSNITDEQCLLFCEILNAMPDLSFIKIQKLEFELKQIKIEHSKLKNAIKQVKQLVDNTLIFLDNE